MPDIIYNLALNIGDNTDDRGTFHHTLSSLLNHYNALISVCKEYFQRGWAISEKEWDEFADDRNYLPIKKVVIAENGTRYELVISKGVSLQKGA